MRVWSAGIIAGLATTTVLATTTTAQAARPITGFVQETPTTDPPGPHAIGPGTIIYFNRNGGTYTKTGNYDSRTNQNNIGAGTITAFNCGDAAWEQVLNCLEDSFLQYDVEITDVDPGNVSHVETVVAGTPDEIGLPANIGGIAPLGCDQYLSNPITFAFGNHWSCNINEICWAAAQETAHAIGLDHSTECTDHLTYDQNCSNIKRFRDVTSACGEDKDLPPNQQPPNASGPRQCSCPGTGSSQNSHQELISIFGQRPNGPPEVAFERPTEGGAVIKGFAIELNVEDEFGLMRVDVFVDGQMLATKATPPFNFRAPDTLVDGPHTITAKAYDTGGLITELTINVTQQPPCSGNGTCPQDFVCDASGECVDGPNIPGGIGSTCAFNADCDSQICAGGPGGMKCTEICAVGSTAECPDGFQCLDAGSSGACWPGSGVLPTPEPEEGVGCGCSVGGNGPRAPLVGFLAGFAFFGVLLSRRRR